MTNIPKPNLILSTVARDIGASAEKQTFAALADAAQWLFTMGTLIEYNGAEFLFSKKSLHKNGVTDSKQFEAGFRGAIGALMALKVWVDKHGFDEPTDKEWEKFTDGD